MLGKRRDRAIQICKQDLESAPWRITLNTIFQNTDSLAFVHVISPAALR